jgi:DsbC/DsbD-like thiol-disulfide interchange protein
MLGIAGLLSGLDGSIGSQAEAAANPFRVEVLGTRVAHGAQGRAEVRIIVPAGHHVYRDMMWVKVLDAGGLTLDDADFPPGLMRPDPADPGAERELYDMDVVIHVPITGNVAEGTHTARIQVGYQGCKGGLCFMPATEDHELVVDITAPEASPKTEPAPEAEPPVPSEAEGETAVPSQRAEAPSWREGALVSAAGGAADGATSDAPKVDFSTLHAEASVQSKNAEGKDHPVHARLLLDHDSVRPGQTVRLGLHLTQMPGWHTYWHSPGDIGLPTDIVWSVPEGATTTDYVYPVPHRYDVQGIISYGYDDEVLLFTELTLPADLPTGTIKLGAKAQWLVCEIMCIPGEAELFFPVEVVADGTQERSAFSPLFDHFASAHPADAQTSNKITVESALSASAIQADGTFKAAIFVQGAEGAPLSFKQTEGTWPAFTPIYQGDWMVSEVGVKAVEGGMLAVVEGLAFAPETLPTSDRIGGMVQVEVGGEVIRTEIVMPLPWAVADAEVTPNPSPLFALFDGAVSAEVAPPAGNDADDLPAAPVGEEQSMAYMLVLAFLGGAILNIMPCVLPVLTLKLYSVVDQQDQTTSERQAAGLSYTAGVVVSFLTLALAVVLLRTVFELPVGWGF